MTAVRSALTALLLAALAWSAHAAPRALPGQTLDQRGMVVPDDLPDGPVLLVIGFSKASAGATAAWSRAVAAEASISGAVAVYRVAVIADVPGLFRGFVVRRMRGAVPEALHGSFVLVTEQADAWKRWVSFAAPDAAYVLLLDRAHEVAWRDEGEVDGPALQSLRAAIGRLEEAP